VFLNRTVLFSYFLFVDRHFLRNFCLCIKSTLIANFCLRKSNLTYLIKLCNLVTYYCGSDGMCIEIPVCVKRPGMNVFVAFFILLILLADNTPPASSTIPLMG